MESQIILKTAVSHGHKSHFLGGVGNSKLSCVILIALHNWNRLEILMRLGVILVCEYLNNLKYVFLTKSY